MIIPAISIWDKKIRIELISRSRFPASGDTSRPRIARLLPEIEGIVEATHYPYKIGNDKPDLGKIMRDADLAQAFSPVWIQQVIIGFAQEWRKPLEVQRVQTSFLATLWFNTEMGASAVFSGTRRGENPETQQLRRLLEQSRQPQP